MSVQYEARFAVARRWPAVPFVKCLNRSALFLALVVVTAGCTSRNGLPLAGPDPSDASAPVATAGYRSVLGDYRAGRPVGPSPWIEQNQRVAPAPKDK